MITLIDTGKSFQEMAKAIANILKIAQRIPDVTKRVLLYLEAIQTTVTILGKERQSILTDVRKCDLQNREQVAALWECLDQYLYVDSVCPQLEISICGLGACHQAIQKKARGIRWRKQDKEAAVNHFINTLEQLENIMQVLTSNFFPGGSGISVQTLVPIYQLLGRVREAFNVQQIDPLEAEPLHVEIAELICQALRDSSYGGWFHTATKVEELVVDLQLAFSVKVTEQAV